MKTFNYLSVFIFSLFLINCSNIEKEINQEVVQENNISLLAPSGEYIAKDLQELKNITKKNLSESHGIDKDFSITSIEFSPKLKKGYLAIINYKFSDGIEDNYALFSSSDEDETIITIEGEVLFESSDKNETILTIADEILVKSSDKNETIITFADEILF